MAHRQIFKAFIDEVQLAPRKHFFSTKSLIQSSVGMIFRITPSPGTIEQVVTNIQNIQLLFAQRAGYAGDLNAYNIVLPGGQADLGQNDLEACSREIKEQVGLKVDEQCIYLGQIPRNFYYMKKRKIISLYMSCHVWALKKGHENWVPELNKSELIDYKWVPFQDLVNLSNYSFSNQIIGRMVERVIPKIFTKYTASIISNIQIMRFPVLQVKMDKKLWGLTLWLCSFVFQMALHRMQKYPQLYQSSSQTVSCLKMVVRNIQEMEIKFKRSYILGYPFSWAVKYWHKNYRVKPFTYKCNENKRVLIFLVLVFLGLAYWYYIQFMKLRYTVI